MARDEFISLPDLKRRFTQFQEIATVTTALRQRLERINDANTTAGGRDDQVGKQYHGQVDKPGQDLTMLVDKIQQSFQLFAENGVSVSNVFDSAEDDATNTARSVTLPER